MTSRIILTSIFVCCLHIFNVGAQVVDYGQVNGVYSFEEDTEGWSGSKRSVLSISDRHSKLGNRSLEWNWKKGGSSISLKGHVPYLPENPNPKETSVSSFVFWIYSPESMDPVIGSLRFSFLKDGRECCHFDYHLGFKGWRGAWVAFDRDMEGTPEVGMDEVRITAPEHIGKGQLFFDGIITASFQDVRYHTADWQAPFINKETTNFWLTLNRFWQNRLDIPLAGSVTPEDIRDFNTIESRFIELVTDGIQPVGIEEIRRIYDSYAIRFNEDGSISGKPIWFIRYGETYLNQGIPDAMKSFTDCGQTLRQLNDSMLRIAVSYMNESDPQVREEMARIYTDLTRHLLDQGFQAGSGQGTLHHLGYSMRNFYTGPVIMKDVLKKAELREPMQDAMEWFSGFGEVRTAPEEPGMDIDQFNTSLMGRFASVLMQVDGVWKKTDMQVLSRWVDNGFKYTEGLNPCFKRDGTVVHHRKCYPEYAVGGFKGSVNAIWMLANTGFAVSEESHLNQKNALLTMRFYSNVKSFPLAMSGRHPDGTRSLIANQFALLADAGSPDRKDSIDTELASAYLRLEDNPGRLGRKFMDAGIKAEKSPVGGRYLAYNCSLSYRQDDWLATIAGHSRYLWAAETYQRENHYGRYLTHGSMQLMNGRDSFDSGYRLEGWDWCHIPGTTAAEIPMERMKADVLNVDEYSGYEEMLLSDEWFAGGVTFGKEAAAYSMILHEHDKYNGSLRAHKSFFAFENRIVCIGTGLENDLAGSELHTTLFQNAISECTPFKETIGRDMVYLQDVHGNAYFISNAETTYSRTLQNSLHEETDAPTQGWFEKAYINHGSPMKPVSDSYEYLVVVTPSQEQRDSYRGSLPYTVLRADNSLHAVRDNETGITSLAAFETTCCDSLVLESTPAMIIYRICEGRLELNVSNPDLALYEGPSDEVFDESGKRRERSIYGRSWVNNPAAETSVNIVIEGEWNIVEGEVSSVEHTDGNTILSITTRESDTEHIILER